MSATPAQSNPVQPRSSKGRWTTKSQSAPETTAQADHELGRQLTEVHQEVGALYRTIGDDNVDVFAAFSRISALEGRRSVLELLHRNNATNTN
jgi:hypothetical protein